MTLRINDIAPDFTAQTTKGPIRFHDWIGDKWAILFSHPKDFTPVCTTELGYMAKIEPEFTRRNAKLIGLSVDPIDSHSRWLDDIEETQGAKVNYPIIGDSDLNVAKLYNMLPAEEPGTSDGRTAATNQTVRSVFIVGPDKKIKLMLTYPMTTGRNFDEILRVLEFDAAHRETQGRDSGQLEAGRRRDHRGLGLGRGCQDALSERLDGAAALPAHHQAAGLTRTRGDKAPKSSGRRRFNGQDSGPRRGLRRFGALLHSCPNELGDAAETTLIDKGDAFVFGYSKLDVMFGRATLDAVRLPYANFAKPQVRLLRETVTAIDPAARRVTTDAGVHEGDVLVVALGADYDFAATPGLDSANEFYSVAGANRLRDILPGFSKGHGIVGVCGAPYKCPPCAERMRPPAARLPDRQGPTRRLRDHHGPAVAESGAAFARDVEGADRGLRRAEHRLHAEPAGRLDRRWPERGDPRRRR